MAGYFHKNPHIIGLTGSFGSGCSYVAKHILERNDYKLFSLSTILKNLYYKETGNDINDVHRRVLQDYGDKIRRDKSADFFAQQVIAEIEKDELSNHFVVDSIKNPFEVRAFRDYSRNFFLFGLYADRDIRWERVASKYKEERLSFKDDDLNDTGEDNDKTGQRVADCFYESDIVISNNIPIENTSCEDFTIFSQRFMNYVHLSETPLDRKAPLSSEEALMAMAYAASQRSSCEKRKVGAIIVDENDNVISSGYNEVPRYDKPCLLEYGKCYRDYKRDKFNEKIEQICGSSCDNLQTIKQLIKDEHKSLDYCRALHAEEQAILNLITRGSHKDLSQCTLYTTTYPCQLCANKIVNVGLQRIVYVEPYPVPEAKSIIKNGNVKEIMFEGVTSRSYFRIYGEKR